MQPCLFASMKKKLIVLKPTGTLASLQCRYIIFEMSFDWYSQNVWNNTYGPTIHLFPIRLLRKNFWCYKMKKEGNLIIMLTDFSANDVLCSERWHIRIHFRCIISQFLWYGFFFFNYVWYLCHLMTFVSSFANPEGFYYDPTYM